MAICKPSYTLKPLFKNFVGSNIWEIKRDDSSFLLFEGQRT